MKSGERSDQASVDAAEASRRAIQESVKAIGSVLKRPTPDALGNTLSTMTDPTLRDSCGSLDPSICAIT